MNLATALILILVVALVAYALVAMHRQRRKGGSCSGCPLNGCCRKANTER